MQETLETIKALAAAYALRVVGAIIVLIIGLRVTKWLSKGFTKQLNKRDIDPSLKPFLSSMVSILLKVVLFMVVIGMVGIETTSLVAILGAAGLAVGLALSGTLQNFAGGVVLLFIKPFRVGDFIEAQSYSGTVSAIQIFYTVLKTPDNKTVIIPNGPLSTGSLINYSTEDTRRVDMVFGIAYDDDIQKAKTIINELLNEDERVLKDPAPTVVVDSLGDSAVNIIVRPWALSGDYWSLKWDLQEKVKQRFDAEGINFPFPQMDVHLSRE